MFIFNVKPERLQNKERSRLFLPMLRFVLEKMEGQDLVLENAPLI